MPILPRLTAIKLVALIFVLWGGYVLAQGQYVTAYILLALGMIPSGIVHAGMSRAIYAGLAYEQRVETLLKEMIVERDMWEGMARKPKLDDPAYLSGLHARAHAVGYWAQRLQNIQ